MRDAINKGIPAGKLKKAISEVADSILGLEAIRKNNEKENKNQLLSLVEKIKPAGKIEPKLVKIAGKMLKAGSSKETSPLIDDMAKLLVYGLSLTSKDKDKGFLSSLIGKNDKEQATEENQEDKVNISSDPELNLDNAIKSLISLLEKMILPSDLQVEANLVKRQLSLSVDKNIFISSLEQTVGITASVLGRVKKEKKEIEVFLKQLTGRLHELDKDIRETSRIRELTHQHGKKMTDGMKSEIQSIEEGIISIGSFEELKTSIQSRVIMLRNHVDTYILDEGEKNNDAIGIIEGLKIKLRRWKKKQKN